MILFTCFEMRREAREIESSWIGGRCGARRVSRCIPVWSGQGTGRRWRPSSCLSLGNPSTTAYHRYPLLLLLGRSLEHSSALSMDPPLSSRHAVSCVSFALFLSLTTLTEYYRSLLSAHCTPQILPVRAPTPNIHWRVSFAWKDDLSSFSLSTKHSWTLCEWMEDSRAFFSTRSQRFSNLHFSRA